MNVNHIRGLVWNSAWSRVEATGVAHLKERENVRNSV